MFSTLFRWELRALRRDPSVWIAVALALAALTLALFNGTRWLAHLDRVQDSVARADLDARREAKALAARLDAANDTTYGAFRDPRDPAGYANRVMAHAATLPATPLAALSTGQSDLLPAVIALTPAANPALSGNGEPDNPHRLLIGRFDAAFVVVYLAPLLILALTCALLSGERERGTLALLLIQPFSPRALVAGRLAPRLLLGLGLLTTLAAGFIAVNGNMDTAPRLALWFGVTLAYGAFWFALAVAVAVRPGSSAAHALILTSLWLAFVVLLPAGINLAVKTLSPVPSRIDLILAMRAATDAASADRSRVLAAYYEDHPELASTKSPGAAEDFTLLRLATTERVERDLAPVLARYDEQLARQQGMVEKLALFSPALLAHTALADAAGTGLARHRAFLAQVVIHHKELRAFFTPRIARKETFSAYDAVPAFYFTEEVNTSLAKRLLPTFIVLLFGTVILTAWTWRRLSHAPL